eukprot:CAMPEP_0175132112 /NCGR_PEP_ID=MMETSP0087-20121206/6903_1 /TAXON_ID=136419 /ORGANISM="Unknown Unknown, Strain D1" /LENGTH=59 /DNA_ID=CAMNT_0016414449 /DNA_START=145 /DNA_END=320 /DNA_ORIENTATION=-
MDARPPKIKLLLGDCENEVVGQKRSRPFIEDNSPSSSDEEPELLNPDQGVGGVVGGGGG